MSTSTPAIILVAPQMGENIGAAARAMLNFGLTDLRLVAPRDGWPNTRANEMSAGAFDIMPPAQVFDTLSEAIADLHFTYGTTSRIRYMTKPTFTAQSAVQDGNERVSSDQRIGFVFGPERTGLDNKDLSQCNAALHIATNSDFPSINLGQAVLLIAYEWHREHDNTPDKVLDMGDSFPAELGDLDAFLERLETELEDGKFFREENLKPTMVRNIRNMFMRTELSDQELRTFHGMVSALIGKKSS